MPWLARLEVSPMICGVTHKRSVRIGRRKLECIHDGLTFEFILMQQMLVFVTKKCYLFRLSRYLTVLAKLMPGG